MKHSLTPPTDVDFCCCWQPCARYGFFVNLPLEYNNQTPESTHLAPSPSLPYGSTHTGWSLEGTKCSWLSISHSDIQFNLFQIIFLKTEWNKTGFVQQFKCCTGLSNKYNTMYYFPLEDFLLVIQSTLKQFWGVNVLGFDHLSDEKNPSLTALIPFIPILGRLIETNNQGCLDFFTNVKNSITQL